jgi:hypothetical protein
MYGAALLKTIEETGTGVLTLVEGLQDSELLASRLTRAEVVRQLRLLAESAMALPIELRGGMPEVDWAGIGAAGKALAGPGGAALDDALVFASQALVPATLMWMRVYKEQHPEWFRMSMALPR